MKASLILISLIFLSSCFIKTVDKDGGMIIKVKADSHFSSTEIRIATWILRERANYVYNDYPSVKYDSIENCIVLKLPETNDSELCKNFILARGEVEIVETYNNTEVYPYFLEVNKNLQKNSKFNLKIADDKKLLKDYPLFTVLSPAISFDSKLIEGPVIGSSSIKDTAVVNQIFNDHEIKLLLPRNLQALWTTGEMPGTCQLIAAKRDENCYSITSQKVAKARLTVSKNNLRDIDFALNPEYAESWARFTKLNSGHYLAIKFDQRVMACPKILQEIDGGNVSITLNMKKSEAGAIVASLKFGSLPFKLFISSIKIIAPR